MGSISGGELLARCLGNEGVKFVFGLPSPEIDPLLARTAGLPTRVVVGFDAARSAGRSEVTAHDATAWAEVKLAGLGWVAFDPVPDPTVEITPPTTGVAGAMVAADRGTPPSVEGSGARGAASSGFFASGFFGSTFSTGAATFSGVGGSGGSRLSSISSVSSPRPMASTGAFHSKASTAPVTGETGSQRSEI